jgi:hypothetical protein
MRQRVLRLCWISADPQLLDLGFHERTHFCTPPAFSLRIGQYFSSSCAFVSPTPADGKRTRTFKARAMHRLMQKKKNAPAFPRGAFSD